MAQLAARLETEIKACLEVGPPPGMSRRVFERVQAAAKVQLLALDEHPDVFHDQVRPAHQGLSAAWLPTDAESNSKTHLHPHPHPHPWPRPPP